MHSRRNRRQYGSAPGFSLIETLVVMVILLIGIFAIIRLFPGGFLVIQRTGEMTVAQSLVQQQLDAQKNLLSTPDSIISPRFDPAGNWTGEPNINPDLLPNHSQSDIDNGLVPGVPPGTHPYYINNINSIRGIVGEAFSLPANSPNGGRGYGAVYMLKHGPVLNQFRNNNGELRDSIVVYGQPMERVELSSVPTPDRRDVTPDLQNASQYAIDWENLRIAFYPRRAAPGGQNLRKFRISYSYYAVESGQVVVRTIIDGPSAEITIPDVPANALDEEPVWIPIFSGGSDPVPSGFVPAVAPPGLDRRLGLLRYSEDVSRRFRLVSISTVNNSSGTPNPPVWSSNDPYEYAWFSEQEPDNSMSDIVNVGALIFNPRGYQETVQTTRGTRPFGARVNYITYDNHIIRDERSVPSQAPYKIKLSLNGILTNGDVQDDGTVYMGMFCPAVMMDSPDILLYNVNTGEEVGQLLAGSTAGAGQVGFTLDSRNGVIELNQAQVESMGLQSASLRIFYRARKDWGMQIQKANANYLLANTPFASDITYRSYYVGGSFVGGGGPAGLPTRIYFPICEAGKTVILGEYFVQTGQGQTRRFTGESYQLNDNPALFENFNGQLLTWLDISSQHPAATSEQWRFTSAETGRAVSNVIGASVKSRVIWRGSDRWRRDEDTTILLPAVQR